MDQLYKDERTGQLWKGINKRGNYIDMERISDKLILISLYSDLIKTVYIRHSLLKI